MNLHDPSDARALLELGLAADAGEAMLMEAVAGRLPGLEVLEVIGQGGMGVVYLARQQSLDRLVAVKVLNPELARRPEFAARFEQEARTLATLQHPGIVSVHDVGEADGLFFIVMEYVQGHNLRAELDEPMPTRRVAATLTRLCEIFAYSHARGVVHRDIKPENILVDPCGVLRVADFGLAKLVHGQRFSLTNTLALLGTLPYMAPEQIEGRGEADVRTDVYALGVLAFEMLTKRLPVGRFGPPSAEGALEATLDDVVMRCLERDPERRFASMDALREAITAAIAGVPARRRPAAKRKRAPELVPMLMVVIGAPLLLLGFALAMDDESERVRDVPEARELSSVRECITVGGRTTCGYNCRAEYGRAICAEKPDMECMASYGKLACGYGCAAAYGRIECAQEPGMACMDASHGTIACGYDCEERDGAVVCKSEDPAAAGVTG